MEVISPLFLYLWTRLDTLHHFFGGCVAILVISAVIFAFVSFVVYEGKKPITITYLKRCVAGLIIIGILGVIIPTSKDAAIIYVIPKIANNENLQKEAGELYLYAKKAMKEMLPIEEPTKSN